MRVIVIANGEFADGAELAASVQQGDILIAADGGARHCLSLGLLPRLVIGDFDSLTPNEVQTLSQSGTPIIQHPRQKDETDLELALRQAIVFSPDEIIVYGALGLRWDMTITNLLLLAHPDFATRDIRLVDGRQEIFLLRGETSRTIHGQPGDTVSLIPIQGDTSGITTQGLEYSLNDERLVFGTTRGVSNSLLGHEAQLQLASGLLLIIHIRLAMDGR